MKAIPDPVGSFNIIVSIVVNDPGDLLHSVQEDGLDVFKTEVVPDVC
jgi:hypothetical protein